MSTRPKPKPAHGSGLVTTAEMAREGLFLKLFGTALITITTYSLLW